MPCHPAREGPDASLESGELHALPPTAYRRASGLPFDAGRSRAIRARVLALHPPWPSPHYGSPCAATRVSVRLSSAGSSSAPTTSCCRTISPASPRTASDRKSRKGPLLNHISLPGSSPPHLLRGGLRQNPTFTPHQ